VIVAVPARPAGRLLAGVPGAGPASAALGEIEYASMAIVTLAYPRAAFPQSGGPQSGERQSGGPQSGERQSGERQSGGPQSGGPPARGSGYLVPAVDGRAVKAVTFSTVKWPHLFAAGDAVDIVRCSIGRIGETGLLQRDDDELAALAAADLAAATGVRGKPLDARVTRWGGALPQYTVGHLDRVARIRAAVAAQPGLAVCGAAYDGLGIPACIATGRAAADRVLGYLRGVLGGRPPR